MSFSSEIKAFGNKTYDKLDKTIRYGIIGLSNAVILDTPVLTGMARNNWNASIGAPDYSTDTAPNKNGTTALNDVMYNSAKATGNVYYLVNALDYIKRLEEGYSKKAPAGMVSINVTKYNKWFRDALK